MSVLDQYTDSKISGNNVTKLLSKVAAGSQLLARYATFEVAAADSDGSVYRVFKSMDPNFVPLMILIACDAITAGTDWDLGLYKPNLGAEVDKDVFLDGQTLASAIASLNPKTALDGMTAVPIESYGKKLYEHGGHTEVTKLEAYDLALTANTVGTAAGTVSILVVGVNG